MKPSRLLMMTALLLAGYWLRAQCPNLTLAVEQQEYCATDSVVFSLSGVPGNALIEWNPEGNYDTAGSRYVYEASVFGYVNMDLRLSLADGSTCTYTFSNVTYIIPPLQPEFNASRTRLCNGPDTIQLKDRTVGSVGRSWVIGSKTYSNVDTAAIVTVPLIGVHSLSLYTLDSNGCGTYTTFYDTLEVVDDIGLEMNISDYDPCLPTSIIFAAQYSAAASVDSIHWSFPGATTSASNQFVPPAISYTSAGTFDVGLQVVASDGCRYSLLLEDTIKLGEVQNLQLSSNSNQVCLSEQLRVTQTVQGVRGNFRWTHPKAKAFNRGKYQVDLVYRDTGDHSIYYEIDDNGCITRDSLIDFVHARGAQAAFSSSNPYHCKAPHSVQLINRSDTVSTQVDSYQWTIRNSSTQSVFDTSALKDPSFTFVSLPGIYDVELITTDSSGCSDTAVGREFIRISNFDIDIRPSTRLICTGSEVRLQNRTARASSATPNRYRWEFLDTAGSTILDSSDQHNPVVVYQQAGSYPVRLIAYNDSGCIDTAYFDGLIKVVEFQVGSRISDTSFCAQDSIIVQQQSTPDSIALEHRWYWMDQSGNVIDSTYADSFSLGFDQIGTYQLRHVHYLQISKQLTACYDTLDHTLVTSGVHGAVVMDTVSGCAPLDIRPRFLADQNVHHGDTSQTLNYYWGVYPESGVSSSGVNGPDPVFTITQEAGYRVSVFVTNSVGCSYYDMRASSIRVGVDAAFRPLSDTFCVGQPILLEDRSRGNPDRLEWIIDPNVDYQLDSIDRTHYRLVFHEPGSFPVQLRASKSGGCTDSRNRRYTVIPISTEVQLRDTLLFCAPQTARMGVVALNVDSIQWFFGDGDSLYWDLTDVSHTYWSNDSFNVFAVGTNQHGCRDTALAPRPLVIDGPRAVLSWNGSSGCAPLRVRFMDESIGGGRSMLDYGDGTAIDSSGNFMHDFMPRPGEDSSSYTLVLWHRNASGCVDSTVYTDAITVYARPAPSIDQAPATEICLGEGLSLQGSATFTDSLVWQWNQSQTYQEQRIDVLPADSGVQQFVLQAFNGHCSASDTVFSYVHFIPSVQWNGPEETCRDQLIYQRAASGSSALDSVWIWDLGEGSHPMNLRVTSYDTVAIRYRTEGMHPIRLKAIYTNGCSDSTTGSVFVIGPDSIPPLSLEMATVQDDGSVELLYTTTAYEHLVGMEILKGGNLLNTVTDVSSGRYEDPAAVIPGSAHCYRLQLRDRCGFYGPVTAAHCVVVLSATSTVHKQIDLSWTPYVGWTDLAGYEVHRLKQDGSGFERIAQLPSMRLTYSDTGLCEGLYTYRIHAIRQSTGSVSKSNRIGLKSLYVPNTRFPDIIAASVVDDQEVLVHWHRSQFDPGSVYQLEKYRDQKSSPDDIEVVRDTFFVDREVLVDDHSYRYVVSEWDRCEVKTFNGGYGRTILLSGVTIDGVSYLNWTPYEQWAQGVAQYQILYLGPAGVETVAQVDGQQLSYVDRSIHVEDANGYYHYAVRAIAGDGVQSLSNVIELSGAAIAWIPNAFSPNGDGHNDGFLPHFRFTRNSDAGDPNAYKMEIYNRWGEHIFETNDRSEAWDGTLNGRFVPQGVYLYRIHVTDVHGSIQQYSGTFSLLR